MSSAPVRDGQGGLTVVQALTSRTAGVPLEKLVAVPVDVGKSTAAAMTCDFTGQV
jgi:hypothetical protein